MGDHNRGPWEIANLLWDIWGVLWDCLKLTVVCFKGIAWISETYYGEIKERKVRDQGKSMRIKGNKCVEMKGQQKSLVMYKQLAGQHDYMAKPCIRAVFLTFFSPSECVLYALCMLAYV